MDYSSILRQLWLSILILFVYFDQVGCKRGGISMGRSRGASAARNRGGSGGGIFGGTRNTGGAGSGGYNQAGKSHIGNSGGHQGSSNNYKGSGGGGYGSGGYHGSSGGYGRSSGPKYTKSGVGSFVRSNQFKSAIVGAAAGYLTYQAGKAIIRNAMSPMMWNNRPYYWGSNYYRGGAGQSMCRMPMDASDPQFGNIYLPDNSRPREIVWGCGYNEYCCGYECCRGNGAGGYGGGGYGGYGTGFGLGSLIVVLLLVCCSFYLVRRFCIANSNRYAQGRGLL